MKSFAQWCASYHAAEKALKEHYSSEFWMQAMSASVRFRFQQYLDLGNWPESPDLFGLTLADKESLRLWGQAHEARLNLFHKQRETINRSIFESKIGALVSLGLMAGKAFLAGSGRIDDRAEAIMTRLSVMRKKHLDGIDYLSIFEVDGPFSKGFFRQTKLNRSAFLRDLRLLLNYRVGMVHYDKDLQRLQDLLAA